jgi:hypothetical protein
MLSAILGNSFCRRLKTCGEVRRRRQDAQAHLPHGDAGGLLDIGKKRVGFADPLPGPERNVVSKLGQGHTPASAPEQGAPAGLFQGADLSADVGLHRLAVCGHFGEAAHFGHFQKELEVLDLHVPPLICQLRHI